MKSPLLVARATLAGVCALSAGAALAQAGVNVDIRNVAADVAARLGVEPARLPAQVRLTPQSAAYVCGVNVGTLTAGTGGAACTATGSSPMLEQVVQAQLAPAPGAAAASAPAQGPFEPGTVRRLITPAPGDAPAAPKAAVTNQAPVSVDVSNIAGDIAQQLKVDATSVPPIVQVPVGVAAQVCGVGEDALAYQQAIGSASCTATTTNPALDQAVKRRLKGANGDAAQDGQGGATDQPAAR